MKLNKITFIFVFFTCLFLQAQIEEKQLDKLVEKTLKTFDVPGISVGILKDGNVVYAKGHGVRALSTKKEMNENPLKIIKPQKIKLIVVFLMTKI